MHLRKITVKNFRNFKHTEVVLDSGFQTIIGENNIGKSNLLYAIRLVLDDSLSYASRRLKASDFNGFPPPNKEKFILISIDLYGENLASHPSFHPLKIGDHEMRISFLFAHKQILDPNIEYSEIDFQSEAGLEDFSWRLYGGGNSLEIHHLRELPGITFRDIEAINLFFLSDFRNIFRDLAGGNKSLLTRYCQSRANSNEEFEEIKGILSSASDELNDLPFVGELKREINEESKAIAGSYFSVPVSMGFTSEFDNDVWKELNIYFEPKGGNKISIDQMGLGQKNLLYLALFIAALENERDDNAINILLVEEPEAHLHPQIQKVLFKNLAGIANTQVVMTTHSTHIASNVEFKNLVVLYFNQINEVKAVSPFLGGFLENEEAKLLRRYLDATRAELFFSSAVLLVEGMSEQFIIPSIAKAKYGLDFTEHNISVVPIHGRHFSSFMKLFQETGFEVAVAVLIDGDEGEESDTFVENAKALQVQDRIRVFDGSQTLEIDLFPSGINTSYLQTCFEKLGHSQAYSNLVNASGPWGHELISRIGGTVRKGRFAQQLALHIDSNFIVPDYVRDAIIFLAEKRGVSINA